jgi:hypothetical protein
VLRDAEAHRGSDEPVQEKSPSTRSGDFFCDNRFAPSHCRAESSDYFEIGIYLIFS